MSSDTYEKPAHGWTCFHCGDTFTTVGSARAHFGATPQAEPGCMERVRLGGERGLLMALREAEALIARHMEEDTDLHRSMHAMQGRHAEQLRTAEEAGYERGLRVGLRPYIWSTLQLIVEVSDPEKLTPELLADLVPESATILEAEGGVRKTCMTYAELRSFSVALLASKAKVQRSA